MKSVSDALWRLDGVAHVTVSLQDNLATITPSPGARLAAGDVSESIRKAGYRPGNVDVIATGSATQVEDRWEFRIPGSEVPYVTAPAAGKPVGALRVRLRRVPEGGIEVEESP